MAVTSAVYNLLLYKPQQMNIALMTEGNKDYIGLVLAVPLFIRAYNKGLARTGTVRSASKIKGYYSASIVENLSFF